MEKRVAAWILACLGSLFGTSAMSQDDCPSWCMTRYHVEVLTCNFHAEDVVACVNNAGDRLAECCK